MDIKDVQTGKLVLPRKEVKMKIAFENSTPSRKQLRKAVADKLKAKEDSVIIRHVYTVYGTKTAHLDVYVYDSVDDIKALEYQKMIAKNSDKEPQAQA